MRLAVDIYKLTSAFPASERFGLTAQLRRAAVSVPSNIAEGYGKATNGEFRTYLGHARGSLYELRTQLRLAVEIGFLDRAQGKTCRTQSVEVGRLVNGLLASKSPARQRLTPNA